MLRSAMTAMQIDEVSKQGGQKWWKQPVSANRTKEFRLARFLIAAGQM